MLNWIGQVNGLDSKKRVSKVFNNNLKGSRRRGRPKNRWWNCVYKKVLLNAKLKPGKRGQKQS